MAVRVKNHGEREEITAKVARYECRTKETIEAWGQIFHGRSLLWSETFRGEPVSDVADRIERGRV
jgi:hypothetical protein